jgi:hypothetical protein
MGGFGLAVMVDPSVLSAAAGFLSWRNPTQ